MNSKTNYQTVCVQAIKNLPVRQREVLERRFGLRGKQAETLQKIGDDFKVTRERVRQIEREGFNKLRKQSADCLGKSFVQMSKHLKTQGGSQREDLILEALGGGNSQNHAHFLLWLGEPFHRFPETEQVFAFWALDKQASRKVTTFIQNFVQRLNKAKKPLNQQELLNSKANPKGLEFAALAIAKQVDKGPLGQFGLTSWPEIKPRGVRDAAFLALKKTGKPLHFREIAQTASDFNGSFFEKRQVLPQTVHNELIRDPRFVLVGRGTYGLAEWGYCSGTVREVIAKVLKDAKKPMARQAIVTKVSAQRLVKPNTILLNLNNKQYFIRNTQGKYQLV